LWCMAEPNMNRASVSYSEPLGSITQRVKHTQKFSEATVHASIQGL